MEHIDETRDDMRHEGRLDGHCIFSTLHSVFLALHRQDRFLHQNCSKLSRLYSFTHSLRYSRTQKRHPTRIPVPLIPRFLAPCPSTSGTDASGTRSLPGCCPGTPGDTVRRRTCPPCVSTRPKRLPPSWTRHTTCRAARSASRSSSPSY